MQWASPTASLSAAAWGTYNPFAHPATGAPFHARDTFEMHRSLGFAYDVLPAPAPPQLREPPFLAHFPKIDISKLEMPCVLYVYVHAADAPFAPPADTSRAGLTAHAGFSGIGSVFFLNNPKGCVNCRTRPEFDLFVDITAALRAAQLHPKQAALSVMVESEDDSVKPLGETAIPPPQVSARSEGAKTDSSCPPHAADRMATARHGMTRRGWMQGRCMVPDACSGAVTIVQMHAL